MTQRLFRLISPSVQIVLALLAGVYLLYFADHARQLSAFPYPLDYGEGPLLAQVEALRAGVPIWRLYANPAAPPYLIINYPPLYLLLTAALAAPIGSALIAGRLLSLLATLGCVAALTLLARPSAQPANKRQTLRPLLLATLFLTVPIVREWSVLMRVDLLGLCLGLWGLVVLRAAPGPSPARAALAGLFLSASLLTKPSLIAAPAAAMSYLVWRTLRAPAAARHRALATTLSLGVTMELVGGLSFGLLQWASEGWFALHVVAANANRWETGLASGFWQQQMLLRWPLVLAAAVALGWAVRHGKGTLMLVACLYTFFGALVALGVGKVGAYSNYFLEFYAGLIWLVALGAGLLTTANLAKMTCYLLLVGSLLYYPPLWDTNRLRQAGLLEPSPPRLSVGAYGLWADALREADLLAAQARVGAALRDTARAAGPVLFTDMPGVAASAGVSSRLQAFEARQLRDQGLSDEGELLHELANGTIPLAVIDYLGNWLTPGVIEILQRRYAQDGSLGTFDLYRPVETGPAQPLERTFRAPGGELHLADFRLTAATGSSYEPGELLVLTLDWRRDGPAPTELPNVVVRLTAADGSVLGESQRPLLYGAYAPADWPEGALIQHMQPLTLPPDLPDGRYALTVGLDDKSEAQSIAMIEVRQQGGSRFAETGYFVPASLMQTWGELGGLKRFGLPLTPVVPFAWGRLQCFELACLEVRDATPTLRPLGKQLFLAETRFGFGCAMGKPLPDGLCLEFSTAADHYAQLGPPLSSGMTRNGWLVQWTTGARLERLRDSDEIHLGRLGEESLRLAPGMRYRWP